MPTPIKPEDLRVGNLVQSKYGEIIPVESVVSNYGINAQAGDGNCMYCDHEEGEIFGIPLTEEWLLKFGFKNEGYDFLFYDKDGLSLCGDNETGFVFNYYTEQGHGRGQLEVATVNQLQNLYYCLRGQELTLKE